MSRARSPGRFIAVVAVTATTAAYGCWPALDALTGATAPVSDAAGGDAGGGEAGQNPGDATFGSTYRDLVLADGPVAYWRLGEAAGPTARDESPNGRHGHYQGNVVFRAPGAFGAGDDPAIGLDGTTASVEIGNTLDVSDKTIFAAGFTIEAWIAPTKLLGNFRRILSKEDLTGAPRTGFSLYIDADDTPRSSYVWFERTVGGETVDLVSSNEVVPLDVYSYVVVTFDDATATARFYMNGKLADSATHKGAASVPTSFIGYWGRASIEDGDSNFAGSLDEIALYPKALDATRIVAHYEAARTPR